MSSLLQLIRPANFSPANFLGQAAPRRLSNTFCSQAGQAIFRNQFALDSREYSLTGKIWLFQLYGKIQQFDLVFDGILIKTCSRESSVGMMLRLVCIPFF